MLTSTGAEKGVVTTKGQLVIPARLRRRLGIRKGTTVAFTEDGGRLVIQPVTSDFIHSLRGKFKDGPSGVKILTEERRKERIL